MLDRAVGSAPAEKEVQYRIYSQEDQVLLQSLLATLANLDFDYERERERINSGTTAPDLKARALRRLEERHRERREPYLRHLTVVQDRVMGDTRFG